MEVLNIVAHHGYLLIAGVLFLFCAGIPLPAGITLVAAGTAAALHLLNPGLAFASALGGCMVADVLLYLGGRTTGWWLLGLICRASLNPDKCMFRSANYFYERGAGTLLTAKFVPGLAMVAVPVAGSLNMPWRRFLRNDAAGVVLYCGSYFAAGYVLHAFFLDIARALARFAQFTGAILLLAGLAYTVLLAVRIRKSRIDRSHTISAEEAAAQLAAGDPNRIVVIADVRSHGYYERNMHRIKNSIRVEPNRLATEMVMLNELFTPECEVFVYCTCAREATSARVANMLNERGIRARVIRGGLRAWKKAGLATEPVPLKDMEHLPAFQ